MRNICKNCGAELKEKYKYIQLKKGSWWFEYNENNILIQTDKAPLSLNQMITDIMVKELKKYYKLAVDLYPIMSTFKVYLPGGIFIIVNLPSPSEAVP